MDSKFDVVISGIGGVFPSSINIEELARNLFRQKTLLEVNEGKWPIDNEFNIKPTIGTVPGGVGVFDASYFAHNSKLSYVTHPLTKLATERSFEAVIDAGVSPQSLKGSNTAVYTTHGLSIYESLLMYILDTKGLNYIMLGSARTMTANRISYYLDLKGKSMNVDGSWASAETILQLAAADILSGEVEAALVVGANIVNLPHLMHMYKTFGVISEDGSCRSFDKNASGGQQSDGCVCLFLQRSDRAKRIYAHVVASRADIIAAPRIHLDPTTTPPTSAVEKYISEIYSDCGVDPRNVLYLEADGSGCKVKEENELNAVDGIFCKGRTKDKPLLIGSVKSIIGNTANASGMMAIAKILVTMEKGSIPGNVNFASLNQRIKPLKEGRMKVVDQNTPIKMDHKSLFASTTLGFTSTVGHAILKPHLKEKNPTEDESTNLPRLVVASGRTEIGVQCVLLEIEGMAFDTEFLRLTHDVFSQNIRGMNYNGFTVVPKSEHVSIQIKELSGEIPLWFVYSGMGSQWEGMGCQLMQFPIFAESIHRLHNILQEKGVDLKRIVTETGATAFDTVLKSFVGITAIQIALTNLLKALEVLPDGIVGHSLGEIACGYADGSLTEEQTILVAWARGRAAMDAELIHGMMAAIGLGYNQIKDILPRAIDVACHNSSTSCTISGPKDEVETFIKNLSDHNVFARIVKTGGIAFHSRYIAPAGSLLNKYLLEVIPNPKPRSTLWHSTSFPKQQWNTCEAKMCSAQYQTNNLLSPVLFEEVLKELPEQAIIVEIAPHGLMQAILKRALPKTVNIPLTYQKAKSPIHFFLQAIGQLYTNGVKPKVSALYPDVQFPVSRGTPTLSTLTAWNHTELPTIDPYKFYKRCPPLVIASDDPWVKIGDEHVTSVSALLNIAHTSKYNFFKRFKGADFAFSNIRFHKKLFIPEEGDRLLSGLNSSVSGCIEILDEDDSLVMTGNFQAQKSTTTNNIIQKPETNKVHIRGSQMYDDFSAFGIEYSPRCRGVRDIYIHQQVWTVAVAANSSVMLLIDSVIQICQYSNLQRMLPHGYPKHILKIEVDPTEIPKTDEIFVQYNVHTGNIDGPGVHIEGVEFLPSEDSHYLDNGLPCLDRMKIIKWGLHPMNSALSAKEQMDAGHLDFVGFGHNNRRVMGVACRTRNSFSLEVDPILNWSVPQSWTDNEATSVPFAYCTAIYALEICCQIRQHDSVLIHSGMSSIGQAAIRIALQYKCNPILITVSHEHEKTMLLKNFNQLDKINIICTSTESFEKHILKEKKHPRIVLNNLPGEALRASLRCLSRTNARLVHYGREDMVDRHHIGMWHFYYNNLSFYGLTGDFLLRARNDHREALIRSIADGLKNKLVLPIIEYNTCESPSFAVSKSLETNTKIVIDNCHRYNKCIKPCSPRKSYAVMGGSVAEWLKVVTNLAKYGAKTIVGSVAAEDEYADLINQRLGDLRNKFGTDVQVSSDNFEMEVQKQATNIPIDTVILISKDSLPDQLLNYYLVQSHMNVLILATSPSQDCKSYVQLCENKCQDGVQAAVVQGPVFRSSSLISNFLSNTLATYTRLFKTLESKGTPEGIRTTLPSSVRDVMEIVNTMPKKPRVRELPIRGLRLRHSHEVFPIFALPPLGILQSSEKEILWAFAIKQHQPVILVELPEGGTIPERAKMVMSEIHRLRPTGPYNILGWTLSTPLALQVTRDIEANGQNAVTFLIDGDVENVKNWARKTRESTLLFDVFEQDIQNLSLEKLESANSWSDRVNILLSALGPLPVAKKNIVQKALDYLRSYLKELSQHISITQQPFQGHVHAVRRSVMEPSCFSYAHVKTRTIRIPALDSNRVATFINEKSAFSSLATEEERRCLISAA